MITYREYCKTIKEDWGKTSPIPKEVYDFPDPLKNMNWIDLGLPSGTLWADVNIENPNDEDGLWTWDEIMNSEYSDCVPTKEQMSELHDNCTWRWDSDDWKMNSDKRGQVLTSKVNGEKILLPTINDISCYGYYWSSTPISDISAWGLTLNTGGIYPTASGLRTIAKSVRLVKTKL